MHSDGPIICFLKLCAKIISWYFSKLYKNMLSMVCFLSHLICWSEIVFKFGNKITLITIDPFLFYHHLKNFKFFCVWEIKKIICWTIYEKKYGFRNNNMTEFAVIQIVEELIEADEKKLINCCVFLNLFSWNV